MSRGHRQARTRAIPAEAPPSGARCDEVADAVDAVSVERSTVHSTGLIVHTLVPLFIPCGELLGPGEATLEEVVADSIAAAGVAISRHEARESYTAQVQVGVLDPVDDRAPQGWRRLELAILVTARRPWHIEGEQELVQKDMARAAAFGLAWAFPGLLREPEWKPDYLPLDCSGNVFPFGDHVRLLREDLMSQAVAVAVTGPEGANVRLGDVDYAGVWPQKSADWMEQWEDYNRKVQLLDAEQALPA
ncbi:hypothetical protein M1P56_16915 [Streptomyces sp. HU2014]|uniref:Uncharacterized protein n=1 Tax=Streptomyces albireticuli TaxID=1940 RepID=A0A1Z2LEG0_9ACTN|nr:MULTISPECIES: hypothetical protein [Streptomyces]ARZ72608.1 hypothetical protein SMD11_7032 [Streptomyces albireticuli]UQI45917.1 hypothetical protein M1P56_16915 [Streptomyces sp. HU2014]